MNGQDEITRTADRLRDALGAAADIMAADNSTVRTRRPAVRRARGWLLASAAASVAAIALAAVLVGHSSGNSGGATITAALVGPERQQIGAVPRLNVPAPDPAVLTSPAVQSARSRVVKIVGYAPSCTRLIQGSGFVYAPQHVITAAHVVAGVTSPVPAAHAAGPAVTTASGVRYRSTVVFYDPKSDIAVLYVPGLNVTPLHFAGPADPSQNAAAAGYPLDGPFTAVPARIGQVQQFEGPDIYQASLVRRQMYQIRALIQEGDSGGPLLSSSGTVDGVLFAVATTAGSQDIAFVLTAADVHNDASAGADATAPVSTQACTK